MFVICMPAVVNVSILIVSVVATTSATIRFDTIYGDNLERFVCGRFVAHRLFVPYLTSSQLQQGLLLLWICSGIE